MAAALMEIRVLQNEEVMDQKIQSSIKKIWLKNDKNTHTPWAWTIHRICDEWLWRNLKKYFETGKVLQHETRVLIEYERQNQGW